MFILFVIWSLLAGVGFVVSRESTDTVDKIFHLDVSAAVRDSLFYVSLLILIIVFTASISFYAPSNVFLLTVVTIVWCLLLKSVFIILRNLSD